MVFKKQKAIMKRKRVFGELEFSILKILREKGSATVGDIVKLLGNDSRYTTVMTVMNRLTEKGELYREKKGRQYEYSLDKEGSRRALSLLDRLKEKIFSGKTVSMLSYLLESDDRISDEELEEMEDLIRSERRTRGF